MSEQDSVVAVDLFCGAGGLSAALATACEDLDRDVELKAINHWSKAIDTHKSNFPWATHLNAKVEELHPPDVVEPGSVDLLIAAPECTHFSAARGGKPVTEQKRASPMHVLDWVGKLRPDALLLENVTEFNSWGPIVDGQPTRDGTKFDAWKSQLEADRYSVRHTTLNAADFGDPTSRRRFFVQARRDYRPQFPTPTHSEHGAEPHTEQWRPAAEIIDWSEPGESIWLRSKPLVNNTMARIAEGVRQHCDDRLDPYADIIADMGVDKVTSLQSDIVAIDDVEQAAETREEPFLVKGPAASPDCQTEDPTELIIGQQSRAKAKDAAKSPVPTIATKGAIHKIHVDPFVLPRNGAHRGLHSNSTYEPDDQPLHTVTAQNHDGHLVWPFLVPYQSEREGQRPRTHAIENPYPTVTATGSDPHLVRPFLVEYYGNSDTESIDKPLPTVTTTDRHALCIPELYPWGLDLRYRMLQPRELAAAQGFPTEYEFVGNKGERTEQIGNAVPVNLGTQLVKNLLLPTDQPTMAHYDTDAPTQMSDSDD